MFKSVSFQDEIPKMSSVAKLNKKATITPVDTSKKLGNVLEQTRKSFWGADTQTVDKFLNEMELVQTETENKIEEPT